MCISSMAFFPDYCKHNFLLHLICQLRRKSDKQKGWMIVFGAHLFLNHTGLLVAPEFIKSALLLSQNQRGCFRIVC